MFITNVLRIQVEGQKRVLSKLSVKKPYTVIVGVILVIVLGAVSLTKMTTDLLPDMSLPYALVITTDMGASPEKVESDVTAPVEASMATTSSIKNVSSASYDNYSMVILEYEQNANMDSVIIEIQQKLDQLEGSFPDGAGKPMIMQIDPDMMPVMVASADVEGMTQSEISDYVENELSPVLESIDGVASVSTTGTVEENIHVTLDQDKIDALNQKIQSKIEEQFTEPQEQLDQAAEQVESGRRQMESGKDQLANQLGQAENEVINGKSQAFVAESDLSQNYTVLKATDELIKRAIPELQSIYEQGMGLKADIEQAQKEAQMNSDDGSRRIEELLEEAKISGDQEQINQILAMTGENQESIAEAGKRLELLQEELETKMHQTIKKVSSDYENLKYNTAIAAMMALINEFYKKNAVTKGEYETLLILLNPVAPHITEELWQIIGGTGYVYQQKWPEFDEAKTVENTVEIAVQINGKTKGTLAIGRNDAKDDVIAKAKESIADKLTGNIVKEIYVPGRIVNIVMK